MRKSIFTFGIAALILCGCGNKVIEGSGDVLNIIMETDIGNDIDDAMAMDLLYKYLDAGKINLLAVNINKEGTAPAEYVDILNTWYGHPDIPIGVIRNGADCENDAPNYAKAVVNMKDSYGNPAFGRSIKEYDTLPDAHILYRKLLANADDNSVVIASVGFSTNLIRLLDTQKDEYSELSGKELVAKKVKLLVTMAGDFEDPNIHEYNIAKDIPAAKIIFEKWPTPIVTPIRSRFKNRISWLQHRERFWMGRASPGSRSLQGLSARAMRPSDLGSYSSTVCGRGQWLVHAISCGQHRRDR